MVYYVEDDASVRELTLYALAQAGIDALGCETAEELEALCKQAVPDAFLLDVMLPGVSGLDILKGLREDPATAVVPVMMITARDAEMDVVRALDGGADDYVTKPFGMMELTSRVRALLRRASLTEARPRTNRVEVGAVAIDTDKHEVFTGSEKVELTNREFDLLRYLMEHVGVVCSREALLQQVWGWDFGGGTRTVDVHVNQLRTKLGDSGDAIETIRGVGYRFREPDAE